MTTTCASKDKQAMSATVHKLGDATDAVNIRQTALYIRNRMGADKHAAAWLAIGQQLAQLRSTLKKTTPRGDNEHIGWVQAFKQTRPNGKKEFPFGRTTAEKFIEVHKFFSVIAMAPKNSAALPSSLQALVVLAKSKITAEQLNAAIEAEDITPFSDSAQINSLLKRLGLKTSKRSPKGSGTRAAHSGKSNATAQRELEQAVARNAEQNEELASLRDRHAEETHALKTKIIAMESEIEDLKASAEQQSKKPPMTAPEPSASGEAAGPSTETAAVDLDTLRSAYARMVADTLGADKKAVNAEQRRVIKEITLRLGREKIEAAMQASKRAAEKAANKQVQK
jgi:hypothetical protein